MMKRILLHIVFALLVVSANPDSGFGSRVDDIREYRRKINETDKVNNLYSIRYGLGRIVNESGLTVDEKRELMLSLKSLSSAFAIRNHYRNAADVWFDYLTIQGAFEREYESYLKDSVAKTYSKISSEETAHLDKLQLELKKLRDQQDVISGIRNKYFTFGGIALGILLIIFGYMLYHQISRIREARRRLNENRQQLLQLFRESVESRMTEGGITFAQNLSVTGSVLLEEMGNQKPSEVSWDIIATELQSLRISAGV